MVQDFLCSFASNLDVSSAKYPKEGYVGYDFVLQQPCPSSAATSDREDWPVDCACAKAATCKG